MLGKKETKHQEQFLLEQDWHPRNHEKSSVSVESPSAVQKLNLWITCNRPRYETYIIVRNGVPAFPLFKALTPWPSFLAFSPSICFPPSFLFHLLLRYFRQFPHHRATTSCPNPNNQPFLKYQKGDFTSSSVTFNQKSIFNILNPFTIGYLNLWDIFRFIFRQLRMTFFHEITVAEKKQFSNT